MTACRFTMPISSSSAFPPTSSPFADAIRNADGVIIVSPEYNWTIPGGLKNALDLVSRPEKQPFRDKPVAIQSATGGPIGGARMQYHLRMALTSSIQPSSERRKCSSGLLKPSSKARAQGRANQKVVAEQLAAFARFIARPKASAC